MIEIGVWDDTVTATLDANVRRGIAALDSVKPGWRRDVNVGRLDMRSANDCVLGQAYTDEWVTATEAYQDAMTLWREESQDVEDRPRPPMPPYFIGIDAMIIASGEKIETLGERDRFARRHGWLDGEIEVGEGRCASPSDEMIRQAWNRALHPSEAR